MIDFFASRSHYFDHLAPIYLALPPSLRGQFWVSSSIVSHAQLAGITPIQGRVPSSSRAHVPIAVSAFSDYKLTAPRRVVFVEHGAGQSYLDLDDGSYAGGRGRDRVDLFICPSERVCDRNLSRYPAARAVPVGCPRLDRWHPPIPRVPAAPATIAVTWHANITLLPETRSAIREFWPMLELLQPHYPILGHAHPRLYQRIARHYDRLGIPHTPDPDDVFRQADILIADNTSLGHEFASLGRPVIWISPSTYRRDIHHGLRFWEATEVYPHASTPDEVPTAISQALHPASHSLQAARDAFLGTVYTHRDGQASVRAAQAIMEYLDDGGRSR